MLIGIDRQQLKRACVRVNMLVNETGADIVQQVGLIQVEKLQIVQPRVAQIGERHRSQWHD